MRKIVVFLLVCLLFVPVVAHGAATVKFYVPIELYNSNLTGSIANIGVWGGINNTQMVSLGYLNPSGLDSDVRTGGVTTPSLVASDRVAFFISNIGPNSTSIFNYRLGVDPGRTSMSVVTGYGGNVTIADDPALEPGDTFKFVFEGWIPAATVGWPLVYKEGAFAIYVSAANEVTAIVYDTPPCWVTVKGITVGEHIVEFWADGFFMYLTVT